ncbi:MAG TPA: lipopolysaccharide kinase InaA family protein, partial [Pseudomonadales bacterium]|nr:lipopolysaccharide kinase InaA family protein [Pseudomonadales bacterium]
KLKVTRIFRLLPGKRIVGVAEVDGRQCLIKCYLGRSSSRYARRERVGVNLIAKSGLLTPRLMWYAPLAKGRGEVLVFEYLDEAISLDDRWRESCSNEDKIEILTRAMVAIGRLHNHGAIQNDIHLGNFLLSDNRLYTIDGGGVAARSNRSLAEGPSLNNLAMFFAQFYPRFDEFAQIMLPAYEGVRGWERNPTRLALLVRQIAENRNKRKRGYIAKAFRECTRFVCKSSFTRFQVCERSMFTPEMERLMDNPDKMIECGKLLKDGNSSTIALVRVAGKDLVIKRYNFKNRWHRIRRLLRRSRGWNSWMNACRMEFLGIPSIKPVALIEERLGPVSGRAYFITEYVEGQDALKWLHTIKNPNGELEALTSILCDLSESQISHGDLKATNFVMSADGPVILDLDSMREHRSAGSFRKAFRRDIDRFMQNWQDRPELIDRFEGLLGKIAI